MTLDEAIKHAEEVAEQNEWFEKNYLENKGCKECAEEHRQLAEWLKELKHLREQVSNLEKPNTEVLDKIRNEFIDQYPRNYANEWELGGRSCVFSLIEILRIIDMYKASPTSEEVEK